MALSHSPSIATSNLVLHLDAANRRSYPGTGNTWYDLSGFGNTCFLTNGPALVGTGGTTAMSFDGSNDYGLIYNSNSLNFFGFALIAWIKFSAIPFSGIAINKESCYRLYVGESNVNNISARISQSWGALTGPGSTQLVANKWYQSVVTADGVNQKLYLNGELDFSNNSNLVSTSGSSNLFIATFLGGSYFMNCQMSQIQIYNQSLSAAQIKQNFNATRDRYGV
jgi:hypothetical protein